MNQYVVFPPSLSSLDATHSSLLSTRSRRAPPSFCSNPFIKAPTARRPDWDLNSQVDSGQGERREAKAVLTASVSPTATCSEKSDLCRIGPQLGLLCSADEGRFGRLEKEQRTGEVFIPSNVRVKMSQCSQVWLYTPVIPRTQEAEHADRELETNLDYHCDTLSQKQAVQAQRYFALLIHESIAKYWLPIKWKVMCYEAMC